MEGKTWFQTQSPTKGKQKYTGLYFGQLQQQRRWGKKLRPNLCLSGGMKGEKI
jgi:hypothetical protein